MPKPAAQADKPTLNALSQQSAAFLLRVTARALRDWPDAPRNADGTYPGPELVAWWRDRVERPALPDDDVERLLTAADAMYSGELADGEALTIADLLDELRDRYGETSWLVLVDHLRASWAGALEQYRPQAFKLPTEAELRQRVRAEAEQAGEDHARAHLRIATTCDKCGKLRRGPRWVKAESPKGYVVLRGVCPDCEK